MTADGRLWTWGRADGGRLGRGDAGPGAPASEPWPREVEALGWMRLRATGVAVGDAHTAALVRSRDEAPPDWLLEAPPPPATPRPAAESSSPREDGAPPAPAPAYDAREAAPSADLEDPEAAPAAPPQPPADAAPWTGAWLRSMPRLRAPVLEADPSPTGPPPGDVDASSGGAGCARRRGGGETRISVQA